MMFTPQTLYAKSKLLAPAVPQTPYRESGLVHLIDTGHRYLPVQQEQKIGHLVTVAYFTPRRDEAAFSISCPLGMQEEGENCGRLRNGRRSRPRPPGRPPGAGR